MEHGRFEYSPVIRRPAWQWPNGARLAVWVVLNIEHYRFDTLLRGAAGHLTPPDMFNYGTHDYGNRVGLWRIAQVLDRLGIKATVALNAEICKFEPEIIEEGERRGWEWMGHSYMKSLRQNSLAEADERALIEDTLGLIQASVGRRPRGWLGPGLEETPRSPDLLRAAGIEYVADWVNDDQPLTLRTASGPLYALPYTLELNDTVVFPAHPPAEFQRRIEDQFDVLYEEGAQSARVMAIALHPHKTGMPHRIRYLAQALEHMARHGQVWWATGSEILDAFKMAKGTSA